MRISGKLYSILFPVILAAILTITLATMHKTILLEILVASSIVSVIYLIFTFSCLYFNIGTRRTSSIEFSDIPGLTKNSGWFGKVASVDVSGAVDFTSGADHPIAWILGFIFSIIVSILLPILIAVAIFILSGGIEVVIFVAALISYYSFYQILRYQLTKRKVTKFKVLPSLWYSFLFTATTIGLVPIALTVVLTVTAKI